MKHSSGRPAALPHQIEGTAFLRTRTSAALFDEQGLGKTRQLIDTVADHIESGEIAGALVVCPNTMKSTWAEEVARHSSLRCAVFGSGRAARRETFARLRADIFVINYEVVAAEQPTLRALLHFKRMALILDESHRIKNPDARVTRAVQELRTHAARRYILTGTPVANKPEDLWSQAYFLDGGDALGVTFDEFRARYCIRGGGYTNLDDLRERISVISLRREKENTITLPPKTVVRVPVMLTGRQRALYDQMRDDLAVWVQSLAGEQVLEHAEGILARLVRLAQLASNPALLDAGFTEVPAKVTVLDQLLPAYLADAAGKAIIWTSFVMNIPLLLKRYQAFRPVALHGAMDGSARDAAIAAFRRDRVTRILIANPAAAREGLTLTEACVALYLDRTFNLVDFLQSQDRIHRLSQVRPCEIVLLLAEDTIDEYIDFALAQKHRLARYAQRDTNAIAPADLRLSKPELLRALLGRPPL